jgi:aryl-alcohol dehydrogenase-like predicted oxidoreductase
MRYRRLGRTDLDVSEIGHGLWGMGGWSGSDDGESMRSLQLALDLGVNFFDTAWAYGNGHSDKLLGRLIKANPGKRIIAASKVPPSNGKWPAHGELEDTFNGGYVLSVAKKIRKALGVDTIDLLQYHVWDDSWATEERELFVDTVAELKEKKIIRWFGLSLNRWEPWNGLKAIETGVVDAVQVIYNIFDQAPEDQLFPACRRLNVGVIARVPLDEGSLAGTLTKDTRFPEGDWRATYFGPENLSATVDRVERLRPLVPAGMTMAELALRFTLSAPEVSTTIVGMRKEQNVRMNAGASDGKPLAPELIDALRAHRWDRKPKRWAD